MTRDAEIQEFYEKRNVSLRDLGFIYKLSHGRIRQILVKRGVKMNPPHKFVKS